MWPPYRQAACTHACPVTSALAHTFETSGSAQRVEGGGGSRTRRDHAHELARVSARQIRQAQRPPGPPLACT
jgi:hypothetical protein